MILRGPVLVLVLLGLVPTALLPDRAGWLAAWWVVGVAVLVGVDVLLAAAPRSLQVSRGPVPQVRLHEQATSVLTLANPGSRRVRGLVRDAWVPSAGADGARHTLDLPAGERRRLTTTVRPTRRGDRPATGVTVRSGALENTYFPRA